MMTRIDISGTASEGSQLSRRHLLSGAVATAGLAATGGLAGCGGGRGLPGEDAGGRGGGASGNLQWWTNHTAFDEKLFKEVIKRFEKAHPAISVKLLNIADANQYYTKLKTSAVAKNLPDVFYARTFDTATNAAKGWQMPLDDLLAKNPMGTDPDDFWPALKAQMTYQGKLYSLPYNLSDFGVYVNKTIFAEQGVDLPTDEWTWEEFFELSRNFVTRNGRRQTRWGCNVSFDSWYMMGMLASNGGATFSEDRSQCVVNSPENVETFRLIQRNVNDNVMPRANALPQGVNPFAGGLLAMNVGGSWDTGATRDAIGKKFEWDVWKLPRGTTGERAVSTAGGAWGISAFTENAEAAWTFLAFLAAPDQQTLLIGDQGSVPGLQSATETWLQKTRTKTPPSRPEVFTEQLEEDAVNWTYPAFWSEFGTVWSNRITAVTNGGDVAAMCRQIQDETNKAAARYA